MRYSSSSLRGTATGTPSAISTCWAKLTQVGSSHQHFVAGLDVGVDGLVQAHLAAGSNQDVAVGVDGAAIVSVQLGGHGVAQFGQAAGRADVGMAGVEGRNAGVNDVLWSYVVAGLTDPGQSRRDPAGPTVGAFSPAARVAGGLYPLDARRGSSGHGSPLSGRGRVV